MDIRVLRYFLAVAQEENILGASKILHVTQPTLSRQLMDLEKELGVTLFLRGSGNRRIVLTNEGMLLRKRAKEIIDMVEKTEAEVSAPSDIVSGNVYIGGGETYAMSLIAGKVEELRKEHPNIHYHFFSGNGNDVSERLDKGLIDFGILVEPSNIAKYDSLRLSIVDTWGVLMRKDHPLSKQDFIRPEDLWNEPLIGSSQRLTSNVFTNWLKTDYEKLNIVATYNLIYNASLLVEKGVGSALCFDKLVSTANENNLCFRPLQPKLEAHWDIVWKKYQVFSKASEVFLKKLQETFV